MSRAVKLEHLSVRTNPRIDHNTETRRRLTEKIHQSFLPSEGKSASSPNYKESRVAKLATKLFSSTFWDFSFLESSVSPSQFFMVQNVDVVGILPAGGKHCPYHRIAKYYLIRLNSNFFWPFIVLVSGGN